MHNMQTTFKHLSIQQETMIHRVIAGAKAGGGGGWFKGDFAAPRYRPREGHPPTTTPPSPLGRPKLDPVA